jgi:hypothetical protein
MEHILGGVYRKRISIAAENGVTLAESEWKVLFSVGKKVVEVDTGVVINDNEVDVYLDTSSLQPGTLKAQLNLVIIDTDAPGGRRPISINISNPDDYIIPSL